ncbi:hypothetical protein [Candidatus Chlorohelix sp.]|uniref:hypothetical protein n=1 Tax=Candidatus Chlorohelix sp. TaxID=3139201 RepID=UPI003073E9AF
MAESENPPFRLTCPICQTHLKVAEGINMFACLNCGNELAVVIADGEARLEPSTATQAELSPAELELVEVNRKLKEKDDIYGVGCAIATLGITLVACISILVANLVSSSLLFWVALLLPLVLLLLVMAVFINSSNRTTAPLIRECDKLQAEIERG